MRNFKWILLLGGAAYFSVVAATKLAAQTNQNIPTKTVFVSEGKQPTLVSELIGMEVVNQQQEKIGEIKDIAMDVVAGKLNYVVFSTGGFLGLGEKLIPLPSASMKVDLNGKKLVLNADKESLKRAQGMDRNNWPAVADRKTISKGDSVAKNRAHFQGVASGVTPVNRPGLEIREAAGAEFNLVPGKILKGSDVLGMDVKGVADTRLGEIRDVAVDLESGRVVYAALASGGFLGLGEKLVAVTPSDLTRAEDDKSFVLKTKLETLPSLPAINKN